MLVHLEHADLVLATKDSPKLVIGQDLALVLRVLMVVLLMYSHILLTTSMRGRGDEPITAASSLDGCRGFIRAGIGFLGKAGNPVYFTDDAGCLCVLMPDGHERRLTDAEIETLTR